MEIFTSTETKVMLLVLVFNSMMIKGEDLKAYINILNIILTISTKIIPVEK